MTENELKLITELDALHALPWAPGMMAICPDGDHRLVVHIQAGGAWMTVDDTFCLNRVVEAAHCTHAPCDALTGWLVGQLQKNVNEEVSIHHYADCINVTEGHIYDCGPKTRLPHISRGETMLEALLRAFKAKLEAEHVRVSTLEGNHD